MTEENDITRYAQSAKHALDAYEKFTLPAAPPPPSGDPRHTAAVMGALIGDLEHLADALGIGFADVLTNGHAAHAAEHADQTRYGVGDQVRLISQPQRCGTITGITTAKDGERLYHVHVAGVPYTHAERGADLEPAAPFPLVPTSLGVITHARQAEETLVELATRARLTGSGGDPTAKSSCDRLISALTWWSGTTNHELIKELSSRIAQRIIEGHTPDGRPDSGPARIASQSFPYDLRDGIPQAVGNAPAAPSTAPAVQSSRSPGGAA